MLRKELPILTAITALAAWQIWDGEITRIDAFVMLGVFGGLMAWTIWQGLQKKIDSLGSEIEQELDVHAMPIRKAIFWLAVGTEVFNRDMLVMCALTISLFVIGDGFRGPGRINRVEGTALIVCYVGYTAYLASTVF